MPEKRNFQQTLFDLQKRFGEQAVTTLAQRGVLRDAIPCGYPALDDALGRRGIPRGHMSVLYGAPTCGATTLTLHLLANAQGSDNAGVYLDPTNTFDAAYAASCGVDVKRLILGQPENASQSVDIAREIAKTGRAALIVIDLLLVAEIGNLSIPIKRLHESLSGNQTTILFLLPAPLGVLDEHAHTCLRLKRVGWLSEERNATGYQVIVSVQKDKPHTSGKVVMLDITFDPSTEGDNV